MAKERVAVVGAGFFGLYAALVLARRGCQVTVIESAPQPCSHASTINQARLHSGLHYPRSLGTARQSADHLARFSGLIPEAVVKFDHLYAISRYQSETSVEGFVEFSKRCNAKVQQVNLRPLFDPDFVAGAFRVSEDGFDANAIVAWLLREISSFQNIVLRFGDTFCGGALRSDGGTIVTSSGFTLDVDSVVICSYARTNSVRISLGLHPLDLRFELAQVVLGVPPPDMKGVGVTVMDGPFWSSMPFGMSGLHSLTAVALTPRRVSDMYPSFRCQDQVQSCSPQEIGTCSTCSARPDDSFDAYIATAKVHVPLMKDFCPVRSMYTVKTVMRSTSVSDARPCLVDLDPVLPVKTVLAGKIASIFELDSQL